MRGEAKERENIEVASLFEVMSASSGILYLLVDKQLFPELEEFWSAFSNRSDVKWMPLYQDSDYHQLLDFSPLIIEIENGNPGEALFHWLLEQGDAYQRFGLVGVYPGTLNDVQKHWARWLTCLYPNGDNALLRFYDPSVIDKLWQVFTKAQAQSFFGEHIALYTAYNNDVSEALVRLSARDWQHDEPNEEEFTQLKLTQTQYDCLFYEQRVNSLASTLHEKLAPKYGWLLPYVNVKERFWEGLAIANEKFPQESSLAHETYAMYRFYLSSHFDEHPEFQRLLSLFPLRESIKQFHEMFQREPDLLNSYRQEGWLGIEGNAELTND